MVCNVIARYCKRIILSSSEISVNPNQYQCNNLLLSSGIEDNWRVAISPWVVLLRILEQMDQLHNLEYPVSILGVLASISRIGTAITIILSDRPEISLPQFCDDIVVFDDLEGIENKELLKYTYNFLKNVLERTRKLEVDVIIINHMLMNYNKTKNIIFECSEYYLNIAANRNACIKFLKSYTELSKKQIEELAQHEFESSFDFVVFRKSHPQYLIIENTIQLI